MTDEEETILEFIKINNKHKYCTKNDVDFLLNLIKKQQAEIEKKDIALKECERNLIEERTERIKKDKIIDEMAEEISERTGSCPFDTYEYEMGKCKDCEDTYKKCWVEYFTNKVEGDK